MTKNKQPKHDFELEEHVMVDLIQGAHRPTGIQIEGVVKEIKLVGDIQFSIRIRARHLDGKTYTMWVQRRFVHKLPVPTDDDKWGEWHDVQSDGGITRWRQLKTPTEGGI